MLLLFIVVNSIDVQATNYFVDSNNGSDSNTGLSSNQPLKSLSAVNAFALLPGDSVLFIRGGIWRGQLIPKSGSSNGNITYGAYGLGDKPLILGSINASLASDWVNTGSHIWQTVQSFQVDIGNIIFNSESSVGVKKWTSSSLTNQGDFWFDNSGTKTLQLYSDSNPANYYSTIELALGNFIVYLEEDSFVTIQNLAFKYGSADGIEVRNSRYITIEDCELAYIGGCELINNQRYGGGIQFWANSNNNAVQRCYIHDIYDDAVTEQGNATIGTTVQQYNIKYINNLISNCSESSFCFFIQPSIVTGSFMKNIYFENNTCINAGGGWAANQRPDLKGFQIYCSENTATLDSIFIRNNIFYKSRCFIFIDNTSVPTLNYTESDYNCWYTDNSSDTAVAFWTAKALSYYTYSQFAAYQISTNEDTHSLIKNPSFVDPADTNFKLSASSPCIDAGVNVGITNDFQQQTRPDNCCYDLGCYQYTLTTSTGPANLFITDKITLFPNPTQGRFYLTNIQNESQIQIYNLQGQEVTRLQVTNSKCQYDVSFLDEGIYLVIISPNQTPSNQQGRLEQQFKLLVQK